jgi:hypothetical protein
VSVPRRKKAIFGSSARKLGYFTGARFHGIQIAFFCLFSSDLHNRNRREAK